MIWTYQLFNNAFIEITALIYFSLSLCLSYECAHSYIFQEPEDLGKVGRALLLALLWKNCMVRFVLVVFLFTVLLIFVSISVCQWLWSVRDCQDIKKQLTGFSSLPSLCIWISFCKRLLGPVMAYPMQTDR